MATVNTVRGHRDRRWTGLAILLILGTGTALRFWRISWGLDSRAWFPDELVYSERITDFIPLSWASFDLEKLVYPSLYSYLAGLAAWLAYSIGLPAHAPGVFSPSTILIARLTSATLGVATIAIVGITASRMYSQRAGLAAAALMAVAPLAVMNAHIAATDVPLTAFVSLAMLAAHALAARGGRALAGVAGWTAGLCCATKYTGLAMLVPLAWAALERGFAERSAWPAVLLAAIGAATFALGFALACPPCIIHADRMIGAMWREAIYTSLLPQGSSNNYLAASLGWYGRPYLYELVASLPFSLGWPLYGLALVGIGLAIRRHELADRLILATVLPYLVFMGHSPVVFPRYLLPLFPGLVILAGRALTATDRRPLLPASLFVAVWVYSLVLAGTQVARFSAGQQESLARWIAASVTEPGGRPRHGVRVAIPYVTKGLDYFHLKEPLARAGLAYLLVDPGHWLEASPEFFVLPDWLAISLRRDSPQSPAARELDQLESGAAGYRLAARWRSSYLQRDLYTRLDPAFAGDLWQGEIGFSVYRHVLTEPGGDVPARSRVSQRAAGPD